MAVLRGVVDSTQQTAPPGGVFSAQDTDDHEFEQTTSVTKVEKMLISLCTALWIALILPVQYPRYVAMPDNTLRKIKYWMS
jgi:hypothetical protein